MQEFQTLLDFRTLLLFNAYALIMLAGIVLLYQAANPAHHLLRIWTLSVMAAGSALLMIGMRNLIPDLISIHLGNSLLFLGLGIQVVVHAHYGFGKWPWVPVLTYVVLAILLFNLPPHTGDLAYRIVISSLALGGLFLASSVLLWRAPRRKSLLYNVLIGSNALFAFLFFGRALATLLPQYNPVWEVLSFHYVVFTLSFGLTFLSCMSFIILIQEDLDRALRAKQLQIEELFRIESERQFEQHRLLLAQQRETIANVADGIAHDFNNVLGILDIELYQIQHELQKRPADALLQAAVVNLHSALGQGKIITHGILSLSAEASVECTPIRLESLFQDLQPILRPLLPEHIQLQIDCAPGLQVLSEPGLLRASLLNLVTNARDAMPKGGTLTLRAQAIDWDGNTRLKAGQLVPGRYAELVVSDTGIGMSSTILQHLGEAFYTTKARRRGHGLGLYMLVQFIQKAGAGLEVISQPGEGTLFRILLPLRIPDTPSTTSMTEPLPSLLSSLG